MNTSFGFSRTGDTLKSQESHSVLLKTIPAKELGRTATTKSCELQQHWDNFT